MILTEMRIEIEIYRAETSFMRQQLTAGFLFERSNSVKLTASNQGKMLQGKMLLIRAVFASDEA